MRSSFHDSFESQQNAELAGLLREIQQSADSCCGNSVGDDGGVPRSTVFKEIRSHLKNFCAKYARNLETMPFLKGLRSVLSKQRTSDCVYQWLIPRFVITHGRRDFLRDALLLLYKLNFTLSDAVHSPGPDGRGGGMLLPVAPDQVCYTLDDNLSNPEIDQLLAVLPPEREMIVLAVGAVVPTDQPRALLPSNGNWGFENSCCYRLTQEVRDILES